MDPKSQRNVVVGMPRALLEEAEEVRRRALGQGARDSAPGGKGSVHRQIGASLHVAVGTVKRHLANVYQKMGVGSRGEATRMALREEWITIQDVTDDLDETEGEQ